MSGYDRAETEVVKRVLRIAAQGAPGVSPAASLWRFGLGPVRRTPFPGDVVRPAAASAASMVTPPPLTPGVPAGRPEGGLAASLVAAAGGVARPDVRPEVARQAGEGSVATPAAVEPVVQRVLAIVSDKTGYPPDMLDLELDLEADLGVDTVKQAETFAAVREEYGIERQESLKLRDFPTLRSVVGFVYRFRPDLKPAAVAGGVHAPLAPRHESGSVARSGDPARHDLESAAAPSPADAVAGKVLAIVAEKTGYPQDMLEMDLDLEADLGVDTVKQAETFAAVREAYGIARQESLKLRDFPTLRHVVEFVYQFRPDLKPAAVAGGAHAPLAPRHETGSVARSGDPARHDLQPAAARHRVRSRRAEGARDRGGEDGLSRRTCWSWISTSRRISASTRSSRPRRSRPCARRTASSARRA